MKPNNPIKSHLNNKNPIHSLRKAGYKIRVMHNRYVGDAMIPEKEIKQRGWQPESRGGLTTIQLTTPEGKEFEAQAFCNTVDNFNRKISHKICLGRIAKLLSLEENA